jgi:hypothetical protein
MRTNPALLPLKEERGTLAGLLAVLANAATERRDVAVEHVLIL